MPALRNPQPRRTKIVTKSPSQIRALIKQRRVNYEAGARPVILEGDNADRSPRDYVADRLTPLAKTEASARSCAAQQMNFVRGKSPADGLWSTRRDGSWKASDFECRFDAERQIWLLTLPTEAFNKAIAAPFASRKPEVH